MDLTSKTLHVICFGKSAHLLETRCKVLATQYQAICVTSFEEFANYSADDVDLVLLCHTLSASERAVAELIARGRWPRARLLQVKLPWDWDDRQTEVACVSVSEGPAGMLHALGRLARAASFQNSQQR